ncbi:hypothetical protein C7E17_26810, partial [Stenotrophomonas maltophilia]
AGLREVMASVGFVPTKVGTYQSRSWPVESIVPTKVGTHQSWAARGHGIGGIRADQGRHLPEQVMASGKHRAD